MLLSVSFWPIQLLCFTVFGSSPPKFTPLDPDKTARPSHIYRFRCQRMNFAGEMTRISTSKIFLKAQEVPSYSQNKKGAAQFQLSWYRRHWKFDWTAFFLLPIVRLYAADKDGCDAMKHSPEPIPQRPAPEHLKRKRAASQNWGPKKMLFLVKDEEINNAKEGYLKYLRSVV